MKNRDGLVQALVIGIGVGAMGAATLLLFRLGASQESVFALLGSIVGASATVAGAAWLADRKARVERSGEIDLLRGEYRNLLNAARLVYNGAENADGPWPVEFLEAIHNLNRLAVETKAISIEAIKHAKKLSFRQRVRVQEVLESVENCVDFHEFVYGDREDDPFDERSWYWVSHFICMYCENALKELE